MATQVQAGKQFVKTDTATNDAAVVSIGTSSATVLAANAERISATIQNIHASNILYLSRGGTAVAGEGIRLMPGEGWVETDFTGIIRGIASAASTTVAVTDV